MNTYKFLPLVINDTPTQVSLFKRALDGDVKAHAFIQEYIAGAYRSMLRLQKQDVIEAPWLPVEEMPLRLEISIDVKVVRSQQEQTKHEAETSPSYDELPVWLL